MTKPKSLHAKEFIFMVVLITTDVMSTGAEDKMKTILNLWEENNSLLQNDEMYEKRKAAVTKEAQDLCISYCLLAKKYDTLKSVTTNASSSLSSLGSNIHGLKHTEVLGSWDDSQWKAINSNPES